MSDFLTFRKSIYDYFSQKENIVNLDNFKLNKRLYLIYVCFCRFPCPTLIKRANELVDEIDVVITVATQTLSIEGFSLIDKIVAYCIRNEFNTAFDLAKTCKDNRGYQVILNVATEISNIKMMRRVLAVTDDLDLYESLIAVKMILDQHRQLKVIKVLVEFGLKIYYELNDTISLICNDKNAELLKYMLDRYINLNDSELCIIFAGSMTISFEFTNEILQRLEDKKSLVRLIDRLTEKMLIYDKQVLKKMIRFGCDRHKLKLMKY